MTPVVVTFNKKTQISIAVFVRLKNLRVTLLHLYNHSFDLKFIVSDSSLFFFLSGSRKDEDNQFLSLIIFTLLMEIYYFKLFGYYSRVTQ